MTDDSDRLIDDVGTELGELRRTADRLDEAVAAQHGLNRTDLRCIGILYRRGRVTAGELAEESGLTPGAITTVLDRMERNGYANRVADPSDRRRVLVTSTTATRELGAPRGEVAAPTLRGLGARRVPLPLVLLALAIACYVASENGVSSWLVRFLGNAPAGVATVALSLFWAGLTGGRIVASRFAGRFAPIAVATVCGLAAGGAIVAAVVVPWVGASIALFGVAGIACGPVYPMIMATAGGLYPARSNAVSGILTAAAVAGSVVYPPFMGFISNGVGLGVGMAGAGLIACACAVALVAARALAHRSDAPAGAPAPHRA